MTLLVLLWTGFLGGAIGSFLNVVVYRLPRGQSLIYPPSHCPKCKHRIRWYDNVPVFGWLLLNGRCRDCGCGISSRYPIVEVIVAAAFLVIVSLNVVCRDNLPPSDPIEKLFFTPRWIESLLLLTPLTTIFAAGLIELDKRQLGDKIFCGRVYISGVVVGVIILLVGWSDIDARVAFDHTDAAFGICAGIAAGALTMNFLPYGHRRGWLVSLVILGMFCGWLDVCIAVSVSLLITVWASIVLRKTIPQLSLALVSFVVITARIMLNSFQNGV